MGCDCEQEFSDVSAVCDDYDPPDRVNPDEAIRCGSCGHAKTCHPLAEATRG